MVCSALYEIRGVAPRVSLDVFEQEVFGLLRRQPRQPLELVLLRGDELLIFDCGSRRALVAIGDHLRLRLKLAFLPFG